jgi:CheY-like chemotaxis protein
MKSAPVPNPYILLVDDNRDGLLVRRLVLEEIGCRVEVAQTGEEGLKMFQSRAFDLVVADHRMPRMDGVELIRRIREIRPLTRVILLSGYVVALGLTEENTGADIVLAKSAGEAAQLTRSIKRLVNRQPARKPPATQKNAAVARAAAGQGLRS